MYYLSCIYIHILHLQQQGIQDLLALPLLAAEVELDTDS